MHGVTLPDLVLVHGGAHAGDCWELTVTELARLEPELRVLAVDLPGRRDKPGDLGGARIADWVDSVVSDVDDAGFGDVVVVGHSMAGLTVPGVVAKLGSERVREMVLLAAFVPPQGHSVADTLHGLFAPFVRSTRWIRRVPRMPSAAARFAFCNGMTQAQRRLALSRIYPESSSIAVESVDRSDMPLDVARTWILTLRDRSLSVRQQHVAMNALGGVDNIICVDTCHDAMYSEPRWLADTLLERCRASAARC
jgi:pimeloyl-ACP methyl ester carboxylesterase